MNHHLSKIENVSNSGRTLTGQKFHQICLYFKTTDVKHIKNVGPNYMIYSIRSARATQLKVSKCCKTTVSIKTIIRKVFNLRVIDFLIISSNKVIAAGHFKNFSYNIHLQ